MRIAVKQPLTYLTTIFLLGCANCLSDELRHAEMEFNIFVTSTVLASFP